MATRTIQPAPAYGSLAWIRDAIASGQQEKSVELISITPVIAQQLLQLNIRNRPIKASKLIQYRRAMRSGLWRGANGETIKIKQDGTLGDGQHRLTAIVEEQVTLQIYIMFGATDDDIKTIDQGAARTVGDIDRMNGGELSEMRAAAARMLIAYDASDGVNIGLTPRISNGEVLQRIESDAKITEAAHWAASNKAPGLPSSAVAFCWYLLTNVHQKDAEEYLAQVCRGVNLALEDPAATVRDFFIARVSIGAKHRAKKIEALLRGWNAYREQRSYRKVVTNGTFPELV